MIEIRWAKVEDIPAISNLMVNDMFPEHGKHMAETLNPHKVVKQIEQCVRGEGTLIAETTLEMVGVLNLNRVQWWFSDEYFLSDLGFYVLPEFRGTAGKKLIKRAARYARDCKLPLYIIQLHGAKGPSGRVMDIIGLKKRGQVIRV